MAKTVRPRSLPAPAPPAPRACVPLCGLCAFVAYVAYVCLCAPFAWPMCDVRPLRGLYDVWLMCAFVMCGLVAPDTHTQGELSPSGSTPLRSSCRFLIALELGYLSFKNNTASVVAAVRRAALFSQPALAAAVEERIVKKIIRRQATQHHTAPHRTTLHRTDPRRTVPHRTRVCYVALPIRRCGGSLVWRIQRDRDISRDNRL